MQAVCWKLRMKFLCVTLLILYSFMECHSEQFQVVGPEAPLVAVAGEDLVLPCFIKPNTSAVDMTVEWVRLDEMGSLVHLYEDHEDKNINQAQFYRGRTSLFKEKLQEGNTSLKLSAVQVSDEGEYKCLIEGKSWYDDITIQVIVEVLGSQPVITMENYDASRGVNLVCEARGWNPAPVVLWLNNKGDTLPAEETQIHRKTEAVKDFSVKRRITVYDYSDSNRFYCRLQQKHHMMETEIIITSKVFGVWKWMVGISLSACVIAVGAIVTAVICYKKALDLRKEKQNAALDLRKEKQNTALALQKEREYAELQRQRVEDGNYIKFVELLEFLLFWYRNYTADRKSHILFHLIAITLKYRSSELIRPFSIANSIFMLPSKFIFFLISVTNQWFSYGHIYYVCGIIT